MPLELLAFGLAATLRALPGAVLRDAPRTPDGGVLADYHGEVDDPAAAGRGSTPCRASSPTACSRRPWSRRVLIARGDEVEMRQIG